MSFGRMYNVHLTTGFARTRYISEERRKKREEIRNCVSIIKLREQVISFSQFVVYLIH